MNFLSNANYKELFAAPPMHSGKWWGRNCAAASPCSFVNRAPPITLEQSLHLDVNGKTATKWGERLEKLLNWIVTFSCLTCSCGFLPCPALLLTGRALEGQTHPQSSKVTSLWKEECLSIGGGVILEHPKGARVQNIQTIQTAFGDSEGRHNWPSVTPRRKLFLTSAPLKEEIK